MSPATTRRPGRPPKHELEPTTQPPPTAPRRLLPFPEVQERLGGISRAQLNRLITTGHLSTVHIGARVFITGDELDRFIASLEAEAN